MEIPEIKSRLTIMQVVRHYGLEPNKYDMIVCPFHEDKNPSLKLYYETNTFNCFSCSANGDVIEFIQLKEKINKHEAILKAKTMIDKNYTEVTKVEEMKRTKNLPAGKAGEIDPLTRTAILIKYLQSCKLSIDRTKAAKEYCEQRNLNYNKLNIGYSSPSIYTKWSKQLKENAVKLGLLLVHRNGNTNRFRNCITFELQNKEGKPVGIYGRRIVSADNQRDKSAINNGLGSHFYLPGKHLGLYPQWPKANSQKLILTESIIDAATLIQHPQILKDGCQTEFVEVLSLYGTNGLTEEHIEAIKSLRNLKEIIFFFDGDEAGIKALSKYEEVFKKLRPEIELSTVITPDNEDINSLSVSHEQEIFTHLLNQRIPLLQQVEKAVLKKGFVYLDGESETQTGLSVEALAQAELTKVQFDSSHPEYIVFEQGDIKIMIWGKIDIKHVNRLRATLHIQLKSNLYAEYRDTIDLYSNNQVSRIIREVSAKLEVGSDIINKTIAGLTKNLEQYRQDEREKSRKRAKQENEKGKERFTEAEMRKGLQFLESKKLMQKTYDYIKNIGLIGEEKNGILLYFILLTRMFNSPLHALVQGKSGSGKTYLLKKIAGLIPKQHIRITTALTENTLYHSLEDFWKHSILLIEDLDGAYNALLPLREMMTNQSICKYTTEKDMKTGEFKQKALYVEGPVCVAGATTKDKIYEDNANRSFQIHINESHDHIERVLEYQRRYISGLTERKTEEEIQMIFKTAQLHLRPIEVIIPFGNDLRIPDYVYKKLRSNSHYMTLIKAIAFWNQKQRKVKNLPDGTPYIEATIEDVEWANYLSKEVLLRKSDELSGALRSFFETIKNLVKDIEGKCFYVKPIREKLRMNPMQISRYLRELDARGYIQRTGGNRKNGYEYEVMIWDDYERLRSGINALDEVLAKLKRKYGKGNDPDTPINQD